MKKQNCLETKLKDCYVEYYWYVGVYFTTYTPAEAFSGLN